MNMDYFNAEKTRDNLVNWIKDWFDRNGKDKYAVIGISGGKDSTVVAALCARALGKDKVLGVLMPNGTQKDIDGWLKYKNIEFKYHPISIPYMIGETKHFYFPDFVVGEQLYEVKGNYFFNEHGRLIDPYDGYKLRLEKQQCMIENNVIILMSSEIEGIEKDLTNNTNNFTLPII